MHVTLRYNVISGLCNSAPFAMREKNETRFIQALIKTGNYSLQAKWANWPQPTERNPTRGSRPVSNFQFCTCSVPKNRPNYVDS